MKLVIFLIALTAGAAVLIRMSANHQRVRGQDANVQTRGTNTSGAPIVGTTGSTGGTGGFVAEAAEMNASETALAALAVKNATAHEVRVFAAELERDHRASGEELKQLAGRRDWAFPQSMDALQAQALQGLQQARGPEFDRAFVDAMVTSHEKALAAFRAAARSAPDAELRAFAAKQIPTLENHLNHARRLK